MALTARLAAVAGVVLLAACHPAVVPTARLQTSGENVRVNGMLATDGMAIRPGARISTGENASAKVIWSDGTSLQLDQRSDPILRWDGNTLTINVGYGWFLIDAGQMEVRIVNELAEVVAQSRVCVNVVPDRRFDVYVLEGRPDLRSPQTGTLESGQKVSVRPHGETDMERIAPDERNAVETRFAQWSFGR